MRQFASSIFRIPCSAALLALGVFLSGCSWLDSLKQSQDDPAFPDWSQRMSGSVRDPQEKNAKQNPKPNSLFFDERSQEIEKSLER